MITLLYYDDYSLLWWGRKWDKPTAHDDRTIAYNEKPTAYNEGATAYNNKPTAYNENPQHIINTTT